MTQLPRIDRRDFLKLAAAASTAAAASPLVAAAGQPTKMTAQADPRVVPTRLPPTSAFPVTTSAPKRVSDNGRFLVIVELQGVNDGLSTLIPLRDSAYRKLRSRTLIDPAVALPLSDEWGLNPKLARLHRRGTAAVAGIGTPNPDGSHFAMMRRWWMGDPTGDAPPNSGFFGRCCDAIGDPDAPAVGLSVNSGPSMALSASRVSTLSLPDLSALSLFHPNAEDRPLSAYQQAYRTIANRPGPAAQGMRRAMTVARSLDRITGDRGGIAESKVEYPGSALSDPLRAAARTLAAGLGVRVIHVSLGGFDTHSNHVDAHSNLMEQLDGAIDAFLADVEQRGLADQIVVATISEFGRRAADNDSNGLDHGAASVALVAGKPVNSGVRSEPSSLTKLDNDGNLRATTNMDRYYASLAHWLGIAPGEVLAGDPKPLPDLFD